MSSEKITKLQIEIKQFQKDGVNKNEAYYLKSIFICDVNIPDASKAELLAGVTEEIAIAIRGEK